MKNYVKEIKRVKTILGKKSKEMQPEEYGMSKRSKKAIKSLRKISKGELLTLGNTFPLRPAENGISIDRIGEVLGKKAKWDIEENEFIQMIDIE